MAVEDPFRDPIVPENPTNIAEITLPVGREASLTLGTDSLIVLDEGLGHLRGQKCCGITLPHKSTPTRSIPFFNILWAEVNGSNLTIRHASPASAHSQQVRVSTISYAVDKPLHDVATDFCTRLLDRAYGASLRRKRIKLLINPFGGQGSAVKSFHRDVEPILSAAKCEFDVVRTQYSGHAKEIAEQLDIDAWDVVGCVSGDGLPHEVFNGLAQKADAGKALRRLAVVQFPAGSGNAMSLNLNGTDSPSMAALCVVKGLRMPLDLMSITQGSKRYISFLSQAFGIVADTDLGTENLRWMGDIRFTYGLLLRLLGKTVYPCDVAIKLVDGDKTSIKSEYTSQLQKAKTPTQTTPLPASTAASGGQANGNGNGPSAEEGLPPLRFGTASDPLPADWEMKPYHTMGNFYSGNMSWMARDTNFFQAALPSDGCLDLINIDGEISRMSALHMILGVGSNKLFDMDVVSYQKLEGYRLIPQARKPGKEGFISIDGESVPFETFQVEVHRGLGTVLSRTGKGYEVPPLH